MSAYDDLVVKNRPAAAPATTYGMNNLSETNVLPWQRTLDEGTQGLLSDRINTASNAHALDDVPGAVKAGSDFGSGHMPTELNGAMGMNPNFTNALTARANTQANASLSRMKVQSDLDAPMREGNAMAAAGTQMRGAEQLKLHNFQQQVQYQDKVNAYNRAIDAERAQILGSILGGAGKLAGAALGNKGSEGSPVGGGNGGASGDSTSGSGPTDNSYGMGGIPNSGPMNFGGGGGYAGGNGGPVVGPNGQLTLDG